MRTAVRTQKRTRSHTEHISKGRSSLFIIVSVMLIFFSVISSKGFVEAQSKLKDSSVSYKYYKSIELEDGDTLWGIAETYMPESCESIYDYIQELKDINGLKSDNIHSGRYLTVTYYDEEYR